MATVQTTIQMVPTYQPFERPPDPVALWTSIPRGLRGFLTENAVLDAKPLDDDHSLTFLGTLPAGFGYVFGEIGVRLSGAQATSWLQQFTLNLQNFYQGHPISMSWIYSMDVTAIGAERAAIAGAYDLPPKSVLWAPAGDGIEIQITMKNNSSTAATAGTVAAFINFWEFDLEQIRKYPINSPFPTHAR